MKQIPHNYESVGLTPTSLTNGNAVPFSHQTITYKGLSNVRVNNSTFENTAVSSAMLTRHQNWGTVTSYWGTVYDGVIDVNLWKIARLGCMIDSLHVDEFGHLWWAMYVLRWLKDYNGVDNNILDIITWDNSDSWLIDPDDFYTTVSAGGPTKAVRCR